jgi:hypothetical protein
MSIVIVFSIEESIRVFSNSSSSPIQDIAKRSHGFFQLHPLTIILKNENNKWRVPTSTEKCTHLQCNLNYTSTSKLTRLEQSVHCSQVDEVLVPTLIPKNFGYYYSPPYPPKSPCT